MYNPVQTIPAVVALRRGSLADFEAANPVLLNGEMSVVNEGSAYGRFKIGNGELHWKDLPEYYTSSSEFKLTIDRLERAIDKRDSDQIKAIEQDILEAIVGVRNLRKEVSENIINLKEELSNVISTISTKISNIENLGHFVGAFDTYAILMGQKTSDFAKGITVNDFVSVRKDETRGNATARYVAVAIDGENITWLFDIDYSDDTTGKADRVADAVKGNFAGLNENGNLIDTKVSPDDYTKFKSSVILPDSSLDSYIVPGFYNCDDITTLTVEDKPQDLTSAFSLTVSPLQNTCSEINGVLQTYYSLSHPSTFWLRQGVDGNWSEWSEVSSNPENIKVLTPADTVWADIGTGALDGNIVDMVVQLRRGLNWLKLLITDIAFNGNFNIITYKASVSGSSTTLSDILTLTFSKDPGPLRREDIVISGHNSWADTVEGSGLVRTIRVADYSAGTGNLTISIPNYSYLGDRIWQNSQTINNVRGLITYTMSSSSSLAANGSHCIIITFNEDPGVLPEQDLILVENEGANSELVWASLSNNLQGTGLTRTRDYYLSTNSSFTFQVANTTNSRIRSTNVLLNNVLATNAIYTFDYTVSGQFIFIVPSINNAEYYALRVVAQAKGGNGSASARSSYGGVHAYASGGGGGSGMFYEVIIPNVQVGNFIGVSMQSDGGIVLTGLVSTTLSIGGNATNASANVSSGGVRTMTAGQGGTGFKNGENGSTSTSDASLAGGEGAPSEILSNYGNGGHGAAIGQTTQLGGSSIVRITLTATIGGIGK